VFSADGHVAVDTGKGVRIFDPDGARVADLSVPLVPYRPVFESPSGPRVAWAPDGRRIASTIGYRLAIAASDGSGVRTLADIEAWTVAWSPDGTSLAVAAFADPCWTRPGIFVVDAASLEARRLTNDCRVTGTPRNDRLYGTEDDDVFAGLGGDDRISAGDGDDRVDGGAGDDVVAAGNGSDVVDGGPGSDVLSGGDGRDKLTGGPGRDRISAGGWRDMVNARDGRVDTVKCGWGLDIATVDPGDRVNGDCEGVLRTADDDYMEPTYARTAIAGGRGDDVLVGYYVKRISGGPGDDQLFGGDPGQRLFGGPGDDVLWGGRGRDTLSGGPGDDVLHATDRVREVLDCGPGRDVAYADPRDIVRASCERIRHRS
jgi:Ca2+-binding RTX toxin-like protein